MLIVDSHIILQSRHEYFKETKKKTQEFLKWKLKKFYFCKKKKKTQEILILIHVRYLHISISKYVYADYTRKLAKKIPILYLYISTIWQISITAFKQIFNTGWTLKSYSILIQMQLQGERHTAITWFVFCHYMIWSQQFLA